MSYTNIYTLFTDYFDNPLCTKIEDKNGYSIYMAQLDSMLGTTYRYLIVMVQQDVHFKGNRISLDQLPWEVFQTRALEMQKHLPIHDYRPKRWAYHPITRTNITNDYTVYFHETLPVEIILLNNGNKTYEISHD